MASYTPAVPRTDTLLLDAHALARQLAAQEMEQWWVAERLGVARRTVSRWVSGQVKRISPGNLTQLARLLGIAEDELLAPGEMEVFATRADQQAAAERLLTSEAIFAAAEQYGLYESMLRAVLHPGLNTEQRAVLYTRLQVAAARQGKHEASRRYAALALENARACGDIAKQHAISINLGAQEAEQGRTQEARAILEQALSDWPEQGDLRHRVTLLINLGNVLCVQGEVSLSRLYLEEAVGRAREGDRPIQLFNALCSLAELEDECRAYPEALDLVQEALQLELQPPQPLRRAEAQLLQAALQAELGENESADSTLTNVLAGLRQFEHPSQAPQLVTARIQRLCGHHAAARATIQDGLGAPSTASYEVPFLLVELARLERCVGNESVARQTVEKARRRMLGLGMQARAGSLDVATL
jgi:tetratricopeptide (TPR) repeat protein